MAAAPAPSRRRSSTGPRRSSSSGSSVPRWAWIAGAAVLVVAAYMIYRRRSAGSSGSLDTSGTPGPDLTGSAAQQPNGGAASVPGNLPNQLVSQPDAVQQQVQTTDTTSEQAPTMASSSAPTATTGPALSYGSGSPLGYYEVGSQYYQQSSPGSSTVVPLPASHPNVPLAAGGASMLPDAFAGTNVHRPGFQPDM